MITYLLNKGNQMEKSIDQLMAELKATREELMESQKELQNTIQRVTKLAEEFAN
jgi:prefoldin subunit 5